MKTFTNYAEKKAKQILNLLQGYTKGIRITAILILLLMGVSNAWGYTLYLYTGNFGSWNDGSAKFQVYTTKDINATSIGNNWYSFDVGTYSGTAYIKRMDSSNSTKWNEFSATISSTNNVVHVTNWNEGYVLNYYIKHPWSGSWSWKTMTFEEPNKYTYVGTYNSSSGANVDTYQNENNAPYFSSITNSSNVNNGVPAIWTYTPSSKTLRIDPAYILTVESDGNGTASGSQSKGIKMNTNYTISATASEGYVFDKWTVTSGSATFGNSANASTTVKVSGNASATVKATFKPASYSITYKDQGGGAFSGTHETGAPTQHTYGTATTLKTATKSGYTFNGWFTTSGCTGTAVTSLGATAYTANITLYAKWTAIAETKYDVTIKAGANGSVSPSGTQKVGATGINATATANTGYKFKQWSYTAGAKANPLNTETTLVTATGNGTVTASFEEILYNITITSNDAAYGDVNPKSAQAGIATQVNITATPVAGYEFVSWTAPSTITLASTTNASTTITKATGAGTVSAKFQEKKHDVIISYKCGNTSIRSDKTQSVGEAKATSIEAPEHTGYTFTGWTLGTGITNHSANTTTNPISITTNSTGSGYTLTANYTKNSYTFNLMQAEGGNATATVDGNAITSPAILEHGTKIALTATEDDKYKFSKWVDDSGAQVSTANPYTHTLTASTTIQPVFTNTNILYLKPNDNWKQDYAWFAACFKKTGSTNEYWVKMKDDDPCSSNGYYKAQIPEGDWDYVIFCRMSNGSGDLNWNNKWNQTGDLTIPSDGKNCFTLPDDSWDGATKTWSTYTSTHKPLVYNVTVPAGTPNCYIIGNWDGWTEFIEMDKVDDTHYTITLPDACSSDGYKYCYGPSWGCEEVANTNLPTTTIADRTHKSQDEVKAWIKYCLVGNNNIGWSWNDAYSFDIAGDMSHNFNANNYDIKVMSSTEKYYTHNEYTYNLHRSHTSVKIPHEGGENNQLILQADLTGTYKFHFDPVSKLLTIEFPEKGYRLKITMTDDSGNIYTSNAVEDATETLSFFAPGTDDTELSGTIILEHKGSKKADIPATLFKTSGVYTAKLNSDKNGITDIKPYDGSYYIRTDGANGGWANYKTDSDNKMTYFVPREEEKYSYYWVAALPKADRNADNGVVNTKACVANDHNDNLAVMLGGDRFTSDADGNVKIIDPDEHHREKINVRFGYNPKTNHFERAMLTGSGNINTFLNIFDPLPAGHIYKTNNNGTLETPLTAAGKDNKFTDVSNWVYERDIWVDVQANEDVTVCLTAVSYNGARNSLFGFNDAEQKDPTQRTIVAKKSTPGPKKMRVIYDFKTNRMIMAWIPGKYECDGEEALIADVLFMRHENDPVPQLTMTDNDETDKITPQIKGIQTQFFAMEFENKGDKNYEEHYWFTLPFDCVVGSISGVPGYMTVWGIQRYDGAERAQKGWFKETETFWEWLGPDDVMEAGVGYVLSFDKSAATWNTFDVHTENADGSITTTQKSLLRLYFPSTEKGFTFQSTNSFEKEYPDEPCNIQREDRYKQDGNWKIIGPLSYNTATADPTYKTGEVWKPEEDGAHVDVSGKWSQPMFRYKYTYDNSTENNRKTKWKYTPEDGEKSVYQAFYGYLVQFAGLIKWSEISQSIHPRLRARTYTDQVPTNITTHLELVDADGVQHDQTFVALNIEGTTTYDLNKDLNKAFNSNFANLYTLSEGIPFAGNTLPMEKVTVPVGVRIAETGEYTFRMPNGTEGIYVTLIDNQTGAQTDMLMDEYTVTLDAGTFENRFYLVVDPDRTATSVENVGTGANNDEAKGVEKFLIDGKLFIRTADGIFDAKGQRL